MLKPIQTPADGDHMRRPALLVALLLLSLALPGAARAALVVGVTDDSGRDSGDGGAAFLARLTDVGLTENRVSIVWSPDAPDTIPSKALLDAYVPNAVAAGVRVVFAVYPAKPGSLTASPDAPGQFAGFLAELAGDYPQVTDFVVGNEPNQPRFWQPQFSTAGTPLACATYEPVLAAGYDALKAVNPAITVIGVGLSPRGNDIAAAADNPSTSPVRCLRDIGAAYRLSGRTKPIMDELAFHAYPERDSQPFGVASSWPKVGLVDLARLKQAVWDAFNGTAQPTFAETGQSVMLPALRLRIAEVGWQVGIVPSAQAAYTGTENVATTDETNQASDYTQAIRLAACDPAVKSLDFFGLEDETDLARWQAGLIRADGTTRPSYDAVKTELATSHGTCAGTFVHVDAHDRRRRRRAALRRPQDAAREVHGLELPARRQGERALHGRPLPAAGDDAHGPVAVAHRQGARRQGAGDDEAGAEALRPRACTVRPDGHVRAQAREGGRLRLRDPARGRDEPAARHLRDRKAVPCRGGAEGEEEALAS